MQYLRNFHHIISKEPFFTQVTAEISEATGESSRIFGHSAVQSKFRTSSALSMRFSSWSSGIKIGIIANKGGDFDSEDKDIIYKDDTDRLSLPHQNKTTNTFGRRSFQNCPMDVEDYISY